MFRYHFWETVYYFEPNAPFPRPNLLPARWLGIAWDTGDVMTFHILTEPKDGRLARVLTRSVIRPRQVKDTTPIRTEDIIVPMFTKGQSDSPNEDIGGEKEETDYDTEEESDTEEDSVEGDISKGDL